MRLAVGSPARTNPEGWPWGRGEVYREDGGGWLQEEAMGYEQLILNAQGVRAPLFGLAVDLQGDRAAFSLHQGYSDYVDLINGVVGILGESGAKVYERDLTSGNWNTLGIYGSSLVTSVSLDENSLLTGYANGQDDAPNSVMGLGVVAATDLGTGSPLPPQLLSIVDPGPSPGSAVMIWGNTAMLSAGLEDETDRVLVFENGPSGWVFTQVLEVVGSSQFGRTLSLHGDAAAIGDDFRTYVFAKGEQGWLHQQTLPSPLGQVNGDRVVTRDRKIYRRSPRRLWEHVSTLPGAGSVRKVKLSGDWVAVEALQNSSLEVQLYRLGATDGIEDSTTLGVGGSSGNSDLALDGNHLVVANATAGTLHYSHLANGQWDPLTVLSYSDSPAGQNAPFALSLSGDVLLVGKPWSGRGRAGRAHLFQWSGTHWGNERVVESPAQLAGENLGRSVSLSVGVGLIGMANRVHLHEVATVADVDRDRLPDAWEVQYGLAVSESNAADSGTGNRDGDRWLNLEEFLLKTDPLVEQPAPLIPPLSWLDSDGSELTVSEVYDFGTVRIGEEASVTFTLRNNSVDTTSFPLVEWSHSSSAEWSVVASKADIGPLESRSVTVMLHPQTEGAKSVSLVLRGSVSDPAPYQVDFSGTVPARPQGFERQLISGSSLQTVCRQARGEIVVAGSGWLNVPVAIRDHLVIRLDSEGVLDPDFDCPILARPDSDDEVTCIAALEDGTLLIGGRFVLAEDGAVFSLMRVGIDGTALGPFGPGFLEGAEAGRIEAISILPDGSVLVGGFFDSVGGQAVAGIACLGSGGALKPGFSVGLGPAGAGVTGLIRDSAQRILISGPFESAGGVARSQVARLLGDGTLDSSFAPSLSDQVACMDLLTNGDIVLGGSFLQVNGSSRPYLAHFDANGGASPLALPEFNFWVSAVAPEAAGRRFVGGHFFWVNGVSQPRVGSFASDWALDSSFPGNSVYYQVKQMLLKGDGELLVAGNFTFSSGTAGRLSSVWAGLAVESLAVSPDGTVRWSRGSGQPVTRQVTFEVSLDHGDSWHALSDPELVGGDWVLSGEPIPEWSSIRARARVENGSSSLFESTRNQDGQLSAIERWRMLHFGSPANSGQGADMADPSRSGVPNLLRFATGLNPSGGVANPLDIHRSGAGIVLSYRRSKLARWSGMRFKIQRCTDLVSGCWEDHEDGAISTMDDGEVESVQIFLPKDFTAPTFFRLSITRP